MMPGGRRGGPAGNLGPPARVATEVNIDIWSDVVCPWCYVGKRRFETALSTFKHADEVTVTWHSFELDPTTPAVPTESHVARLAAKFGTSGTKAQQMLDQMTNTAAAEGLEFRFDLNRSGNTFDAHRLLHFAAERGLQAEVKERLFRATFTEGQPIGDHRTLIDLAAEVGLDAAEVADVLAGDAYANDVRLDERQATQLGITGVPFFVLDGKYGVSGAQPAEVLRQALNQAWAARAPLTVLASPQGAESCEGDSCAI